MNLLSTRQAAERLGISPRAARQLVHAGKLPVETLLGGHFAAIAESSIQALLEKRGGPGPRRGKKIAA